MAHYSLSTPQKLVARWFGCSVRTVQRYRSAGLLPALPQSEEEARAMAAQIVAAADRARDGRGRKRGRPSRAELARAL